MNQTFDQDRFDEVIALYRDYLSKAIPLNLPHYLNMDINLNTIWVSVFRKDEIIGTMLKYSIDKSGLWDNSICDIEILEKLFTYMLEPEIDEWKIEWMTRPSEEVFPF